MPNTIESQLSPEDIEKLHKMKASFTPVSEAPKQQVDSLPRVISESASDIDLSNLPERWRSPVVGHVDAAFRNYTYLSGEYVPSKGFYTLGQLPVVITLDGQDHSFDVYRYIKEVVSQSGQPKVSGQEREHIMDCVPDSLSLTIFENGMAILSPGVWKEWMSRAGYSDVEDWTPVIIKPEFAKTQLKEGEAFIQAGADERWTTLRQRYASDTLLEPGTTIRVAEWSAKENPSFRAGRVIALRRDDEELNITPSDFGLKTRRTIFSALEKGTELSVLVGTDENGKLYMPKEELDRLLTPVDPNAKATVDAEILKPDSEIIIEAIDSDKPAEEIAHETGLDQARIEHLIELRTSWNCAYLAECKIENVTRKHPYIVCVLPEEIEGRTIEHAVAENAEYGNAVFIVRGEEDDWKEVLLDKTKRQAVDLGAKRVPHQGDWRDRVLDILTES